MRIGTKVLTAVLLVVLLPSSAFAANRYGLPPHADDAACEALAVTWYESVHRPSLAAPAAGGSYDGWGRELGGPGRIVATGGIDGFANPGQWWLANGALDWVRRALEATAPSAAPSVADEFSSKGPSSATTEKTDPDGTSADGHSTGRSEETASEGNGSDAIRNETSSSEDGTATPRAPENDALAGLTGDGADTTEDVPDLTANSKAERALAIALKQVGKPYVWGAEGPDSFDCSGLMYYSYGKVGIRLPRVAKNQAKAYPKISLNEIRPGDLIFFYDYGHVGMYMGDGKYVHAPGRGKKVRVESLAGKNPCDACRVN